MANRGLATSMQILAFLYAALTLLLAVAAVVLGTVKPFDWRFPVSLLASFVFLGCAVLFGVWLAGIYRNASPALPMQASSGWTIGSWYIPVANIGTPHGPMLQLWRRSTGQEPGAGVWTWLLAWSLWWSLSLVTSVAGFVVGVGAGIGAAEAGNGTNPTVHMPAWLAWLDLVQAVVIVVAAVGLLVASNTLQRAEPH